MGDKILYIITTWNGVSMYRYIFEYKYIEYYMEYPERREIEAAFFEKSGIKDEKIINIEESGFVRLVA